MGASENLNMLAFMETFAEDAFRVKRAYIDATEDLVAGILLGQIVFWSLPNKNGSSKLRIHKEGYYWIAKPREEWWDEIRISPKQFDRASKILQEKQLIVVKLFKFSGKPTVHIRLDFDVLVNSIFPKGQNGFPPKGKMDFPQRVKCITEITTEITTDKDIYTPVTDVPVSPHATTKKRSKKQTLSEEETNFFKERFEELWKVYPSRQGKKAAFDKYCQKIVASEVDHETLVSKVSEYQNFCTVTNQFPKHFSTWLNQHCWEDEYIIDPRKVKSTTPIQTGRFSERVKQNGQTANGGDFR